MRGAASAPHRRILSYGRLFRVAPDWLTRPKHFGRFSERPVSNQLLNVRQCKALQANIALAFLPDRLDGNVLATPTMLLGPAIMPRDAIFTADRSRLARSKVSNGKRLNLFGDGRSAGARRYRDLIQAFGLEGGGFNQLAASDQQIVRRLAQVSVELELLEAARAEGGEIDPVAFCTLVNSQRRLLGDLERIKAAAKRPAPTLAAYVKERTA